MRSITLGGCAVACALGVAWSMSKPVIQWQTGMRLPFGRGSYSSGIIHGMLVLAGGTYWKENQKRWLDEVIAYDPVEDRWNVLPPLPKLLGYAASATKDNVLFVLGGCGPKQQERKGYRLELVDGKYRWDGFTTLPANRCYAQAVVLKTDLYLIGGSTTVTDLSTASNTAWKWSLADQTPQWKAVAPLPGEGRAIFAATECAGKIYVFGGCFVDQDGELRNLRSAYEYDPADDRWRALKNLPIATRAWSASALDDRFIFLFGGYSTSRNADEPEMRRFQSKVYRYDIQLDTYEEVDSMPSANADISFHLWKGAFYGAGGEPGARMRSADTLIGRIR